MASIERTAYPRFKRNPTLKELHEVYTPTSEEMQFAHSVARGSAPVMSLLVMMKSFQRLGYFPRPKDILPIIVSHIRSSLHLSNDEAPNFLSKSLYRHQSAIREYLKVTPYGKHALRTASSAIYRAAQVNGQSSRSNQCRYCGND